MYEKSIEFPVVLSYPYFYLNCLIAVIDLNCIDDYTSHYYYCTALLFGIAYSFRLGFLQAVAVIKMFKLKKIVFKWPNLNLPLLFRLSLRYYLKKSHFVSIWLYSMLFYWIWIFVFNSTEPIRAFETLRARRLSSWPTRRQNRFCPENTRKTNCLKRAGNFEIKTTFEVLLFWIKKKYFLFIVDVHKGVRGHPHPQKIISENFS